MSVAVIGAGPAGLMAAEILSAAGKSVTLYDRMPSVGRKLLMAGRGGLNLTHSEPLRNFLTRYGHKGADWLSSSLGAFPPAMLQAWCEGLGQETFAGSSGRIFPKTMKAAPLLRAWMKRLQAQNVRFALRHRWEGWDGKALRFTDAAGETVTTEPGATLLALGGASWPRLGSDGAWFGLLEAESVPLAPLRPANSGFLAPWSDYFTTRFAGSPLKPVVLTWEGVTRQGEITITSHGMEGGLLYMFGAGIREALERTGSAVISFDLRPGLEESALARKLDAPRGNKSLSSHLRRAGLSPLAVALLRERVAPESLAKASPLQLAGWLKALPVTFTGTAGLARAISTAGGVKRSAVDASFMLHARPGVFVAGEMLDWEAPTGGYLLQACFSTAKTAAEGMLQFLDKK